jgi:hypothetical protein
MTGARNYNVPETGVIVEQVPIYISTTLDGEASLSMKCKEAI